MMEQAIVQILVYVIGAAVVGIVGYMIALQGKVSDVRLRMAEQRAEMYRHIGSTYLEKGVESKIFEELRHLAEQISNLREELRVGMAQGRGTNGGNNRRVGDRDRGIDE